MPHWLQRILSHPRALLWIVPVAIALLLPSLTVGFVLDDKFHQVMLRGDRGFEGLERGPHQLYELSGREPTMLAARREGGSMPWYTAPSFKVNFWRPLSSLTLYADHTLSPGSAVLGHLDSIAWFVLLLVLLDRIYRRLLPQSPWIAALAVLLCAADEGHAMSVGWIANRNAPVATCFAALTLLLHLRWRQDRCRISGWLAPVSLAAGLMAGEMALIAAAYLFAFAVFLDDDRRWRRILSLAPYLAVILAWRAAYGALGYGAHGSHFYVDPSDGPIRFAASVVTRLPLLLAAQLTPLPADLGQFIGRKAELPHLLAATALLVLIAAVAWRWIKVNPVAKFAVTGMVLAAIPLCSAGASNRLLLPLAIGGAPLVAQLVGSIREARARRSRVGLPVRVLAGFFVISHLVLAPLLLPLRTLELSLYDRAYVQGARSLDHVDDFAGRTLVIVNGPDFFFTWWAPVFRFSEGRSVPAHLRVLGDAIGVVEVTRVDDRTLRLRARSGFAGHTLGPIVTDPDHPIEVGYTYALSDLSVTVRALTPDGRPAEIECQFATPLEDDHRRFVVWTHDGYRRFALPAAGVTAFTDDVTRAETMRYTQR